MAQFATRDVEGYKAEMHCDGTAHFDLLSAEGEDGVDMFTHGPCDGSCTPEARRKDVRLLVAERAAQTLTDEDLVLSSVVEYDADAERLFAGDQPVTGVEFESWYAKRSGEGCVCCDGTHHIRVAISHDWWGCHETGRYETIAVTAVPCDGSCRPEATALRIVSD